MLGPAVFIETEPLREINCDLVHKKFILKLDQIHFTCEPTIKFEDVKDILLKQAKEYLDKAVYYTRADYEALYAKQVAEWLKENNENNSGD